MMQHLVRASGAVVVLVLWSVSCAPTIRPTATQPLTMSQLAELWQDPADISTRDLYNGPWGAYFAPDPNATYTFVKPKTHGISPGFTVRDPEGVEWSAKQGPEA